MYRCNKCRGYHESGGGLCPACRRNDELADEQRNIAYDLADAQEQSNARLQHDAHLKNVISKLLDLAIESVEDSNKAEKKVKIIMKSALFTDNEYNFFPEIKANVFLADCYYKTRLSLRPSLDALKELPDYALRYIPEWERSSDVSVYSEKILTLYEVYQAEFDAELKAEEKKKEKERKKAETEQKKADIEKTKQGLKDAKAYEIYRKEKQDELKSFELSLGKREITKNIIFVFLFILQEIILVYRSYYLVFCEQGKQSPLFWMVLEWIVGFIWFSIFSSVVFLLPICALVYFLFHLIYPKPPEKPISYIDFTQNLRNKNFSPHTDETDELFEM